MGTPVARRVATRGYTSGLVAIGERNHYSFPRRWITLDHRDADFTMRLGPTSELPLPDDSVHIVYSAHILEHLDDATISGVLSDVYRILRPGGAVRVEVPDADFLVDAWRRSDQRTLRHFRTYRQKIVVDQLGFGPEYLEDHLTPLGEIANYLVNESHVPVYAPRDEFEFYAALGLEDLNAWAQSLKTPEQDASPGHRNALTFEKMESAFAEVGFTGVVQVDIGRTTIPDLRLGAGTRAPWDLDTIHEKPHRAFYSLFVEAIKP